MEGNLDRFTADMDPTRSDLVTHERMVFANLRHFHFSHFEYQRMSPGGPLGLPAADQQVVVLLVVGIAGLDMDTTSVPYTYTFTRSGSRAVIAGIQSSSWNGLPRDLPWDDAPLKFLDRPPLVVAADESVADLPAMTDAAAAALDRVRRIWGDRPVLPGFLVFFTADDERFRRWFGSVSRTDVIAVQIGLPDVDVANRPGLGRIGSRVILNLSAISPDDVSRVLEHELAHAVADRSEAAVVPPWVNEGFATWVDHADAPDLQVRDLTTVRNAVRSGQVRGLPPDDTFYQDARLNYPVAYTVFRFVTDRWGEQKAVDLYIQLAGPPRGYASRGLGPATTAALGIGGDEFVQQWLRSVAA